MQSTLRAVILLLALLAGCTQVHQVDLTQTPGFEWDGKVRVTTQTVIVPWPDSRITTIELVARDGRVARIVPEGPGVQAMVDLPVTLVNVCLSQPAE